jgi:hypothetical protein
MKSKIIPAFLFACLALVYTPSMAQSEDDAKTLFGNGKPLNTDNVGLFVAPAFGLTQMDGSAASLFNLRGGLNFDDKLSLGAYFSTSMNQIRPESELVPNVYMDYWTVGAFAEYTLLSKRAFHLTFPLFLGYGEVEMDNNDGELQFGEANFFQIEPSALLEVNLHKYVRFNLGAGYRLVGDMNYRNFDQSDISGVTAYAGLKFGLFQ